jgi:2'-5' RNA ligase
MKRLFLGIPLPTETVSALATYLAPYRADQHLQDAKWTTPENHHFTVFFLGDIADSIVPEVQTILKGVVGHISPFTLDFEHVEFFSYKVPKMIWARFQRSLGFLELSQECRKFCQPYMAEPDDGKEPIPHVTLARLRQPVDPRKFSFKPLSLPPVEVTGMNLYESDLTPNGPVYTVLDHYDF